MENLIIAIILSAVFYTTFYLCYRSYYRRKLMHDYTTYMSVLQFNMDKAYETVYKDDILIYSVEATKISDKDFNNVTKKFVTLVIKLLGKTLTNEFVFLFGNYDTFVFNIADYFNRKYEEDEVRKGAVDNLMDSEIEAPQNEGIQNARWISRLSSRDTEED